MRLGKLVVISLTVAPLVTTASQEPPPLKPGDRIRVTAPRLSLGPLVGTVAAFHADSPMVQRVTGTWLLSLASLTRLEMSQGRRSHAGLGAGIGLLAGAGVGAAIGSGCHAVVVPVSSGGGCIAVGAAVIGGA